MSEHTPGPWWVDEGGDVRAPNWGMIAVLPPRMHADHQAQANANAQVMSALPELLRAAILVTEGTAVEAGTTPLRMRMLRDAISKATGGDHENTI